MTDQATPSSSTSVSHITQAVDGILKVAIGRVSASIIFVFNGTRSMRREPFVGFRFPPVSQVVSGLDAPGGVLDVFESRFVLTAAVICFVQNRIAVQLLHQSVVSAERFRYLAVTIDPDTETVDMPDCPVRVALEHDIRVLGLAEGPFRVRGKATSSLGTGLIGKKVVMNLRQHGHEVMAASPSLGVNTVTGQGLAHALAGAQMVVEVANAPSWES